MKEMLFMSTNQMELFEIEVENQHENEERQPVTGAIEGWSKAKVSKSC